MKKMLLCAAALVAMPASATVLLPGAQNQSFSNFQFDTQGTRIAFSEVQGQAQTFSAIFRSAVYRNTSGKLDFYYQVERTGLGSNSADNDHEITKFTVGSFNGWLVDALVSAGDPDGTGAFKAVNNPVPAGGSTTRVSRGFNGTVIETNFQGAGANGLIGTENSATYIFRTNAFAFKAGSFGVLDDSSLQGITFAPTVPEPATWAMMLAGFGMLGGAVRRKSRVRSVLA
ncbi:hypothetical protein SCH01S_18_00200 [Sphingomonas changbaiensis NBRC 104936]|jgi:hypothetical protein|uniref:Ice-binding protein C-terminal domain-containing protein n=1 Tax=Sphingomonas changbaiensis NBRC 104936 TaxID=1219043 RepID=A0A0E9MMF2_9SPHN|nr:PEPxxWA-CTERM sorting domain-containing protein [Sphingomonas changbaiensis]GAO38688.1 hypothetical protein SCH01S_18_00200 [Sphingomonas changbaiensis NBRC 104936]